MRSFSRMPVLLRVGRSRLGIKCLTTEGRSAGIKREARICRLGKKADHVATEHRKEKLAAVSDWRPFSYMRGLQVYSFSNFLLPPRKLLVEICFHLWEDWKNEGQTVAEHLAIRGFKAEETTHARFESAILH